MGIKTRWERPPTTFEAPTLPFEKHSKCQGASARAEWLRRHMFRRAWMAQSWSANGTRTAPVSTETLLGSPPLVVISQTDGTDPKRKRHNAQKPLQMRGANRSLRAMATSQPPASLQWVVWIGDLEVQCFPMFLQHEPRVQIPKRAIQATKQELPEPAKKKHNSHTQPIWANILNLRTENKEAPSEGPSTLLVAARRTSSR